MFFLCKYMLNPNKLICFFSSIVVTPLTLLVAQRFDALLILSYEYQQASCSCYFYRFTPAGMFLFPYIYSFVRYPV